MPTTTSLQGEVVGFDEKGQVACRAHFVDGILHGLTERYDEAQRLAQTIPHLACVRAWPTLW